MARENQLSRWGAISKILPDVSPLSKVFFVGDTDDTSFVDFVNEFPPDKDGVVRVYSDMFDTTLLANLRAGKGDVVFVMPGYSQSITSDKAINVNGVKFIGLGSGNNRPTLQFDATSGSVSLDTDNIHLENFRLLASVSGITRGVDVNGAACAIKRCSFQFDSNGDDFITTIRVTANGDHSLIEDNEIAMEDTTGPETGVLIVGGADFVKVKKNYITGEFSGAGIESDSTAASSGLLIKENSVNNSDTAGLTIGISHSNTKGLVAYNGLGSGDTQADINALVKTGATKWLENYINNDTGEGGGIVPTTVTST